MFISMMNFAQTCGFTQVQNELESKFPQVKKDREAAEARLLQTDVRSYLNTIGATSKNGMYTGTIYEIPVVVHVITSNHASNSGLTLSDAQIQTWIENCNKMYDTTYGNGFFPEGPGSLDGNVIPFKLVLAKRTPQCTVTNGIVRANGSSITGYDQNGVNRNATNGASIAQVRALSPHWAESAYFNIYIVLGFDGDKGTSGLMGWCSFPSNPDSDYDSFMRVAVVTNNNDTTLAHEFGHGIGLDHVFEGASSEPTNNPPLASDCPVNNNCTTDNDKVCDTAPSASLLNVFPTPKNTDINPCTGLNYDGVQYNVMNYTDEGFKFTTGQRDRGVAMFMASRANLTKSLGATDLTANPGAGSLTTASCSPAGIVNNDDYQMGPTKVQLGTIDNSSEGYNTTNLQYYVDYSTQNCTNPTVSTEISETAASQLSVSFKQNPQDIKAWIDYNNNGTFEASELIGESPSAVAIANSPYVITFTPPASAVKNTYLRMRVIADDGINNACENRNYGQAEDYSVKISTTLATGTIPTKADGIVIYSKSDNKLTLVNSTLKKNFGPYEVYNMSGRIIQKGNARQEIILKQALPKGTYIIKYQNTSQKFMN